MKIITMQRLTLDGEPVYPDEGNTRDWWCVIETLEEQYVYNQFVHEVSSNIQDERLMRLWNGMVKHAGKDVGLKWGDDDVYGYISPNDKVPEVRENFKDGDGDIWVRVD